MHSFTTVSKMKAFTFVSSVGLVVVVLIIMACSAHGSLAVTKEEDVPKNAASASASNPDPETVEKPHERSSRRSSATASHFASADESTVVEGDGKSETSSSKYTKCTLIANRTRCEVKERK
jgi:hypothetical protein